MAAAKKNLKSTANVCQSSKHKERTKVNKESSLEALPKSYFFKLGKFSRPDLYHDPILTLRNVDFP